MKYRYNTETDMWQYYGNAEQWTDSAFSDSATPFSEVIQRITNKGDVYVGKYPLELEEKEMTKTEQVLAIFREMTAVEAYSFISKVNGNFSFLVDMLEQDSKKNSSEKLYTLQMHYGDYVDLQGHFMKIQCIKAVREIGGYGLSVAKNMVDDNMNKAGDYVTLFTGTQEQMYDAYNTHNNHNLKKWVRLYNEKGELQYKNKWE